MHHYARPIVLAALAASAAAFTTACGSSETATHSRAAKSASPAPPTPAARPTLAAQLQNLVKAGSPGVIALVNNGDGIQLRAAGVADQGSGRAMRSTDSFRIGSNTKTFVATVALQLVAEGKLKLSDTVEHWLPGVAPYNERATVTQLLNMTAGVPDYVPGLWAKILKDPPYGSRSYEPRDLIAMVADKEPDFAPGTSWAYSSTNTILAGLIIERATGHSLEHELEQRILEPLHLRHTSFPGDTTVIKDVHGYGLAEGEIRDFTAFNASAGWAAGAIVSTGSDMARFWRGLLGGKLLAPAQLAAMKTTVDVGEKDSPVRYGLGLIEHHTACGTLWGNGGDLPGFSSEFLNSEDGTKQAGIIVNLNPLPKTVSGEPLGSAKTTAMADALGREHC